MCLIPDILPVFGLYDCLTGVVISNRFNANTKPHLYEKWGHNNQSMATSRLQVIF